MRCISSGRMFLIIAAADFIISGLKLLAAWGSARISHEAWTDAGSLQGKARLLKRAQAILMLHLKAAPAAGCFPVAAHTGHPRQAVRELPTCAIWAAHLAGTRQQP